jgi:hypothetical protein
MAGHLCTSLCCGCQRDQMAVSSSSELWMEALSFHLCDDRSLATTELHQSCCFYVTEPSPAEFRHPHRSTQCIELTAIVLLLNATSRLRQQCCPRLVHLLSSLVWHEVDHTHCKLTLRYRAGTATEASRYSHSCVIRREKRRSLYAPSYLSWTLETHRF